LISLAKDGTNRGGYRPGAGRPPKPLNEKILDNPGKRPITQITAEGKTSPRVTAPKYIQVKGREGAEDESLPAVKDIYNAMRDFLVRVKVLDIVSPVLIEDFALLRRSYFECESMNRKLGRIADGKQSPYVRMALDYQKSMMLVFNQIWSIVQQNSAESYEKKNEFLEALRGRGF
jgi:hypothetical protein